MIVAAAANSGDVSWTDSASVLLAGVAFIVSFASLWLTSLRRAKVEVDRLHEIGGLRQGGTNSDGMPAGAYAAVYLFLANTGATGTVVTRFDTTDFHEDNAGRRLWSGIDRLDMPIGRPVALTLERDDAQTFEIAVHLAWNPDPPIPDTAEYARRLRTLRAVAFTLRWEWRRTKFLNPRRREVAPGHQVVVVDADAFKRETVTHWRANGFDRLADIVEGVEPDA